MQNFKPQLFFRIFFCPLLISLSAHSWLQFKYYWFFWLFGWTSRNAFRLVIYFSSFSSIFVGVLFYLIGPAIAEIFHVLWEKFNEPEIFFFKKKLNKKALISIRLFFIYEEKRRTNKSARRLFCVERVQPQIIALKLPQE